MDRFDAVAAFIAVCDANGFAAAARRLRVSPSVVTRQVASLERHLGARLLQRTTRSIGLTETGQHFLERARKIMADLGEAERAAQDERAAPSGTLASRRRSCSGASMSRRRCHVSCGNFHR